ncbi:MAG: NAD(P)-dependent glycerol-1-phosphate dehydrogenase [Thermoproteota archaeon]|nr:MAG: NAD(P)-dependent glycerol-1-phosphate dehydrogenase [Candidatus Korarchaeota archaeon]RLG53598.1 MAG: NAD(P)-dependent glycerol-1-phosphate dehydrogenase [Candidatus Korarchaeota archaeon]
MALEHFQIPRYILFGPEALEQAPQALTKIGLRGKALVISGGGATAKIADRFCSILEDSRVEASRFTVESRIADVAEVLEASRVAEREKTRFVLAVGGGRIIDVGKLVAANLGQPYVSVPTSASHDGIASPSVSFLLKRSAMKAGIDVSRLTPPLGIIADTKVISSAPPITFRSGCGDILAKVTAIRDWKLAHKLKGERYSEYAAAISRLSFDLIKQHAHELKPGEEKSSRLLVKTLIGSGVAIGIAGSSRPASGSEHMFSHALDLLSMREGYSPAPHGIQVALGTIMMAYLHELDWMEVRRLAKAIGLPVTAREAGIPSDLVVEALTMAHRIRNRYTILGETGLTREAAEELARSTMVID